IAAICTKKGVRCVSFRQLADWLDAQDPATLAKLRTLKVGQAPEAGWPAFLGAGVGREQPASKIPAAAAGNPAGR
ncbi:hypothetical protein ACPXCX_44740, partial [Streptomyces sp. DT225]